MPAHWDGRSPQRRNRSRPSRKETVRSPMVWARRTHRRDDHASITTRERALWERALNGCGSSQIVGLVQTNYIEPQIAPVPAACYVESVVHGDTFATTRFVPPDSECNCKSACCAFMALVQHVAIRSGSHRSKKARCEHARRAALY